MKAWKYSGLFLIAIEIIHTLFAIIVFWPFVKGMVIDGLTNAVTDEPESRFAVHWFLLSGYFWIATGILCHWIIRKTDTPLPIFFGVLLLIFGLLAVGFQPLSGTWVFVILGIFMIYSAKRNTSTT